MGQARTGRGSSAVSCPRCKGGHARIESLRLDVLQGRLPHGHQGTAVVIKWQASPEIRVSLRSR